MEPVAAWLLANSIEHLVFHVVPDGRWDPSARPLLCVCVWHVLPSPSSCCGCGAHWAPPDDPAEAFGGGFFPFCETVPGTGEVARFPVETLGTHKDGNTEHNVTSTGSPTATPGNESLTKQPHSTIEGVQTKAVSPAAPSSLVGLPASSTTTAQRASGTAHQDARKEHVGTRGGGWGSSPTPSVGWQHQVGRHRGT
jgi:hypothetical protein